MARKNEITPISEIENSMHLLVNPKTMISSDGYAPPPLGLLYLAAMDQETVVFDAAREGDPVVFIHKNKPSIVGVTMYTPGRVEGLKILKAAKEAGARTVAGGPHTAVMTKQLVAEYPFIDHIVIGDGEPAWAAICRGEELPKVIKNPVVSLDSLPMPRWSAVDLLSYQGRGYGMYRGIDISTAPRISVVLGRGCVGRCTFCSTWWVNGSYRAHGREWMRAALEALWNRGVRHLVFQDDCLTSDRKAAVDLCEVLSDFEFVWFGTTRADKLDQEMAEMMKACGCYELSFGIESGSPRILKRMNKMLDLDQSLKARIFCSKAGIKFTALMMFGFPYESAETARETQAFLDMLRPDNIGSTGMVMVFPGTALYHACKEQGLIDDSFWLGDEPWYVYKGGLEE